MTQPPPQENKLLLLRHLGTSVLGDHMGGCQRAGWYRLHNVQETNPRKSRLVRAEVVNDAVKNLYLSNIARTVRDVQLGFTWPVAIPGGNWNAQFQIEALAPEGNELYGIIIRMGGGFAFRNEVFGTKYSKGRPKESDVLQAWVILATCPLPLTRVEILYVDRGMMDDVTYVIPRAEVPITSQTVQEVLATIGGQDMPACSYEKDWTNAERVARLYADKKITKEKYENFKNSNIGGDWQCEYCEFRDKCYADDRTFR